MPIHPKNGNLREDTKFARANSPQSNDRKSDILIELACMLHVNIISV